MTQVVGSRPLGRVLVTGAAGFLGRAVVDALAGAGEDVIGADRDVSRGRAGTRSLDLTVPDQVNDLISDVRPDTILHFAAFGAGSAGLLASAQGEPRTAVAVNVEGFAGLLEAARSSGVGRVVWSSSTTVYGPPATYAPKQRVTEDDVPAPTSVYGATKMIAERFAARITETTGMSVTALRLPLVYGPGRWYGGAQANWMRFAADVVTGTSGEYVFSSVDEDWIFIDDAVASVSAAARAEGTLAPAYNVAGTTTSPYHAARCLVDSRGGNVRVSARDDGHAVVLVDGRAFAVATGFAPRVGIDDGVQRFARTLEPKEACSE